MKGMNMSFRLILCIGWTLGVVSCSDATADDTDAGGDTVTVANGDSDTAIGTNENGDSEQNTPVDGDGQPGENTDTYTGGDKTGEVCGNSLDDDADGFLDCADAECVGHSFCTPQAEDCEDELDNDLDGQVDCSDNDCADQLSCQEKCSNGVDDDADGLVDCDDDSCMGIDAACGEVCGDGVDNDQDGAIDCDDADCAPSGACVEGEWNPTDEGIICAYGGEEPHVCACDDVVDNDEDGEIDSHDLHCFGPFDDDEATYATGISGDNKGSKANKECPFDGNSGIGNDDVCCNPTDPTTNVTPNGCDDKGCCEIDVNKDLTGEHVYVSGECEFAPECGTEGTHGCPCNTADTCDDGQFCIPDGNTGSGFCSKCEPCEPNEACANSCDCGEICFAGFSRPPEECGIYADTDVDTDTDGDTDTGGDADTDTDDDSDTVGDSDSNAPTCPTGLSSCPNGSSDCDQANGETCVSGCCYSQCPQGVTACNVNSDCLQGMICNTGCCIFFAPVI